MCYDIAMKVHLQLNCCVLGCDRFAQYKEQQICQKHYFRIRRNGTSDLVRIRKARVGAPGGYQWVWAPKHPLSVSTGYVSEHRKVLFDDIGSAPMSCELCGVGLTWGTCHVDHKDDDRTNNVRSNLRPTCVTCNTRRGMRAPVEWNRTHKIEFNGEAKTPAEWARDPRVSLSGRAIVDRKSIGMSDEQALFAPKITHNGRGPVKPPTPPKSTRKNAINLTIDGKTLTAMEWSRDPRCTVTDGAIRMRVKLGWSHEKAVFEPGRLALLGQ